MTAVESPARALTPFGELRRASVQTWRELPRVIAASAIVVASGFPLVLAIVAGAPVWLVGLAGFPLALLVTALARVGVTLARDGRVRVRELLDVDPLLAAVGLAAATAALWLSVQPGLLAVVGFALGALWLAIVPRALSYGAVRDRRGFVALRGGAILAAYRPGTTLTIVAIGVLGGFAVVATLGTGALVVPALLAAYTARVVAGELRNIDDAQEAQQ